MGSFYCLDVGCGDASIISTDTGSFLIDCHNISEFSCYLPSNKNFVGVFITHQHTDHFSGLKYLYDNKYSIECLIYSPYTRRNADASVTLEEWNEFISLKDKFLAKGTKLFTPHRQVNFDKPYWDRCGIKFEIIGPSKSTADSETREIHDASLVIKAIMGTRKCLFAGDASDTNLEYVEQNTNNFCDDILHASHHGSINGAHLEFIKKCNAKYSVISTRSGVYENVPHDTAMQRYRNNTSQKVYRTDTDGTIKWNF